MYNINDKALLERLEKEVYEIEGNIGRLKSFLENHKREDVNLDTFDYELYIYSKNKQLDYMQNHVRELYYQMTFFKKEKD